jgi:hypothetical protein
MIQLFWMRMPKINYPLWSFLPQMHNNQSSNIKNFIQAQGKYLRF